MPQKSDMASIAEKMTRFTELARVTQAMSEADNAITAVHELAVAAAAIERDYAALTTQERAALKENSRDTIKALESYITGMKCALEDTSQALEKLNDANDAAGAYASAQHAS